MAVNPLYRNEFYFFSNMYDDSLITDFYRKISAESYKRSVGYQQNMLGRKRHRLNSEIFYKSTLGNFEVDNHYNALVGLPAGSRTLQFNTLILPVFHKKKFISTYGLHYPKIPLVDFFKRNDIFDKSITLQIGKYRIMSAYLIQNIDKSVTLAISNSNTDGISSVNFDKIIAEYSSDEPVWIFSDEITQAYYADTTATATISATATNRYYDVKIPISSRVNQIGNSRNHAQSNSWDCLISLNSSVYGRKVLVTSPCTFKSATKSDVFFSVSEGFINMIKASSINFNIWFINRPNKKHILLYPYSSETYPILNLEYAYNPSGNINIEVFEVESATMCKGRKLYDPDFTQIYFPNIFDFSKLNINNSDLLIEVTEYSPTYTNQQMANSIQPLIDSLGHDLYAEFVVNGHDKSLNGKSMNLKNYHPEYYPVDFTEFTTGEYKNDFRGYILDKISKTIESDPYLAASYYKWMLNKNSKVTTLSGTPKLFKFGTKNTGEFSGSNKIVMDSSIASITSDDIQYFTEEHSYITYYSSNDKCPACVYVNGKYIRPTCIRYYKGLNYIFLPIRLINTEMAKYDDDAELIAASPITVDSYPHTYSSFVEVPKDRVIIESVSDIIKLFDHTESPLYSLDELVVYNTSTGEYLGTLLDVFNINLLVSEYRIDHPGISDKILVSRGENPEYLLTALGEIYSTMDTKPIIISASDVGLGLNSFIDEMVSEGIISDESESVFTHKKLNFNDLEFVPKDASFIGMDISIYSRAFKHEIIIDSTNGLYDSTTNTTKYKIAQANLDPDLTRYFIYKNNLLCSNAILTKVNNKHGADLELSLQGDQTANKQEILIVHMPIHYHSDSFYLQNRVFYMKPAIKNEISTELLWPNSEDDGIILQSKSGRVYNNFAFESDTNIKFSSDGYRLPPRSANTNSLYQQYYDGTRANIYGLHDNSLNGTVFFINNDQPIIDIAKQNLYSEAYDDNYTKNPLDVLTYIDE